MQGMCPIFTTGLHVCAVCDEEIQQDEIWRRNAKDIQLNGASFERLE